jgi:hypothetical protein
MMRTAKATGIKSQAGNSAVPVNLKVKYTIDHNSKPLLYIEKNSMCTIEAEIRGTVEIEIISPNRYRHNLELLLVKDAGQYRQKLEDIYIQPFCALTQKPEMVFKTNKVILTFHIPAKSDMSPFIINVFPHSAGRWTGTLKPLPISGMVDIDGRAYKYKADFEFLIDVQNKISGGNDNTKSSKQDFPSALKREIRQAGASLYDTFSNKEFYSEIGRGFATAGRIVALTHAATSLKAYAIFELGYGGPLSKTAMVAAGTPTGQRVIIDLIPSMNPGTLPSPTLFGFLGWYTGSKIEKFATECDN